MIFEEFQFQVRGYFSERYVAVFDLMMSYPEIKNQIIEILDECYTNARNFKWDGDNITLVAGIDSCEPSSGTGETINKIVLDFAQQMNIELMPQDNHQE